MNLQQLTTELKDGKGKVANSRVKAFNAKYRITCDFGSYTGGIFVIAEVNGNTLKGYFRAGSFKSKKIKSSRLSNIQITEAAC